MSGRSTRRNVVLAIILVVIVLLLLFLLARCKPESTESVSEAVPADSALEEHVESSTSPAEEKPAEVLTAATLQAPEEVSAGAAFPVSWTGPDNPDDYVTIVRPDAADDVYDHYRNTSEGDTLELTAPIEAGDWELRYVAGRSRTVLGRLPLKVTPIEATLESADEIIMGSDVSVTWIGPDNQGDYITIVLRETPEGQYGNYTLTSAGSPLTVRAPIDSGDAEIRYMTGQGNKVIGRRAVTIVVPEVSVTAPASAVAGSTIQVTWTGPNNAGDYLTIVAGTRPDGQYGNYTYTADGSPLALLTPVEAGEAEVRYMTGQGAKVLARAPIVLLSTEATLWSAEEVSAGADFFVTWVGPDYDRDYITVVPKDLPDGQYHNYTYTRDGSPLSLKAPDVPGNYELRYVTGQGAKTIVRQPIRVTE